MSMLPCLGQRSFTQESPSPGTESLGETTQSGVGQLSDARPRDWERGLGETQDWERGGSRPGMNDETCAPPFDYWIIGTMEPKDPGFPQESHAGGRDVTQF